MSGDQHELADLSESLVLLRWNVWLDNPVNVGESQDTWLGSLSEWDERIKMPGSAALDWGDWVNQDAWLGSLNECDESIKMPGSAALDWGDWVVQDIWLDSLNECDESIKIPGSAAWVMWLS